MEHDLNTRFDLMGGGVEEVNYCMSNVLRQLFSTV